MAPRQRPFRLFVRGTVGVQARPAFYASAIEALVLLGLLLGQQPAERGQDDNRAAGPEALREDFEQGTEGRWVMLGEARTAKAGQGQVLTTEGMAFGVWQAAGELSDFALRFRYRHGRGVGDIALRVKGVAPPEHLYHVMIADEGLALVREEAQQQRELARATHPFQAGKWCVIQIRVQGGGFGVAVGEQQLINAEDPNPLPAGFIGLGSLSGQGFGYDDVMVRTGRRGTAPSGERPGRDSDTPPVKTGPVAATELAVLQAPAVAALQQAGITRFDQLAPRLASGADLTALSQETGVPAEHLLFLAEAAELSQFTGAGGIASRQVAALQRLDLARPEDLAGRQKHAAELQERLAGAAANLQAEPAGVAQVKQWTGAAKGRTTALAIMQTARAGKPRNLTRAMPLILPDSMGASHHDTAPGGGGGLQVYTITGMVLLPAIAIQPGQDFVYEFDAVAGGLYRVDYALTRPGGAATLAWSIEKPVEKLLELKAPNAKPVGSGAPAATAAGQLTWVGGIVGVKVTGYKPLVQGGAALSTDVAGAPGHLAFFWVRNKDVGWTRKLRLRLKTVTNVEALAKGDASGIEQGATNEDKANASPVIGGSIQVTRVTPKPINFGGWQSVDFFPGRPDSGSSPLRVMATPHLQRLAAGENPWGLTARLEATPNTYAPYMVDPVTGAPSIYSPGQYHGGQVICEDEAVAGTWSDDQGAKTFSSPNPRSGVYHLLVGPFADATSFAKLTTTGEVWGPWRPENHTGPTELQTVTATLKLEGGGKLPSGALVAELMEVQPSDQSEKQGWTDELFQDNAEGLGEFKVETAALLRAFEPDEENRLQGAGAPPEGKTAVYPAVNNHLHVPGVGGNLLSFPHAAIGWWPMEQLAGFGDLEIVSRISEDDAYSSWSVLMQIKDVLFKMVEVVWSMWKGDADGVLSGMKGYVQAILKVAPLGSEDDLMGAPCLGTTKHGSEWGFVAEDSPFAASPDEVVFSASGTNRQEFLSAHEQLGVGGHSLGHVSTALDGDHTAAVRIRLRRNVPVLQSWAEVQLLDFTMGSADLDADRDMQQSPMDVYVVGGFGGSGEYKWNPYFRRNIWGSQDESLGYNLKFWDWDVSPGQKVVVSTAAPPKCDQQGGVLLPQFHKGPLEATPYTYTEIGLWDADPGHPDDLIGIFSRTFYHDEIRRLAGDPATAGQWIISGAKTAKPSKVIYRKEGPFCTAEIIGHNLGNHLDEIHVKVWVYIWEG